MDTYTVAQIEGGKEAGDVEGLIAALNDPHDVDVRSAAAETLGQIGGQRAVESLVGALSDPDARVRSAAALALSDCGDGAAAQPLQGLMDDPDEDVRRAAIQAIIRLAGTRTDQRAREESPAFSTRLVLFLLGAALWTIPFLFFSLVTRYSSLLYVSLALSVLLLIVGMRGWDTVFVDKRGHASGIYKFAILMMFAFTGVGLIPVFYWTGKGALRIYGYFNRRRI
jgi:hypothetical protein